MSRQRGITKLEFLVVVAVIGLLAWLGLGRLNEVQEIGEKAAVEATIRNIQSGLRFAMADAMTRGQGSRVATMLDSNPVGWLERPPEGYVGEGAAVPESMPPGGWFFDTRRRELIYRPRLAANLVIRGGEQFLRWRIRAGAGASATIVAETPYRWF